MAALTGYCCKASTTVTVSSGVGPPVKAMSACSVGCGPTAADWHGANEVTPAPDCSGCDWNPMAAGRFATVSSAARSCAVLGPASGSASTRGAYAPPAKASTRIPAVTMAAPRHCGIRICSSSIDTHLPGIPGLPTDQTCVNDKESIPGATACQGYPRRNQIEVSRTIWRLDNQTRPRRDARARVSAFPPQDATTPGS